MARVRFAAEAPVRIIASILSICLPVAASATSVAGGEAELPAAEVALERSIAYHDPNDVWSTRAVELTAEVELSERLARERGWTRRTDRVAVDLSNGWFRLRTEVGEHRIEIEQRDGSFHTRLNGSTEISESDREAHGLRPEQIERRRDYFTYVYGMPMKLRDPGTNLDPAVGRGELEGRAVLVLRVTYSPEVGRDTWYFYLDPASYALVGCRFYHDESANDGEYLVFDGEVSGPDGLRLPRRRSWHMNRDGERIAVDDVVSIESVHSP